MLDGATSAQAVCTKFYVPSAALHVQHGAVMLLPCPVTAEHPLIEAAAQLQLLLVVAWVSYV